MSAHAPGTRVDRVSCTSTLGVCSAERTTFVAEEKLWAYKRQKQLRDLEQLEAGFATEDQMSWFSGGRARACRLLNSPY